MNERTLLPKQQRTTDINLYELERENVAFYFYSEWLFFPNDKFNLFTDAGKEEKKD